MEYSVKIIDTAKKIHSGSANIPITLTVENRKGDWYIVKKEEEP